MPNRKTIGGVIHAYQGYDPCNFPSPTQPLPDLVSGAFEHLLAFGSLRQLTQEELARAVRIDPSQIVGLGPSLESLIALLEERKQRILARHETTSVTAEAARRYRALGETIRSPGKIADRFRREFLSEQIHGLERLWYSLGDDRSVLARQLVQLISLLGDKYQVDELAAKYAFTGREPLTVQQALAVKEELESIDRLLRQLREAARTAQIGVIDLESLSRFADQEAVDNLGELQRRVSEYLRQLAQLQGLELDGRGYHLSPKAYRLFQNRLLERIFSQLHESRSGRHQGPVHGDGAVETQKTREYAFGDSVANMDIVGSLVNAMIRSGTGVPVRLKPEDILVHQTRNNPKCATVVLLDMSGSMRYDGQYINVKRMALALDGLIRKEFPGDYLQFVELYTFARPRHASEIATLLPKPVTIVNPTVRLWADMSQPNMSELLIPPHFTNIQHGLQHARRFLAAQDTPNRQIILITDGLPTAHFEGERLYLLYPPDERTEQATLREGLLCSRDQITINLFLLPSWSQSEEDIRFAYRLAESTMGRVFFTAGKDLDRYVVWDYLQHRRDVVA